MDAIAELRRRLDNLIRLGTIAEVDHQAARVRVQSGNIFTNWLPWLPLRAGASKEWDPPTVGEQVVLISPAGELAIALALPGVFSDSNPPPTNEEHVHHRAYPDGAVIEYNHQAHTLKATLPGGGKAEVTAPGGITLKGPTKIEGKLEIQGLTVTHNGVNIGATHLHPGVFPGPSVTGTPQ